MYGVVKDVPTSDNGRVRLGIDLHLIVHSLQAHNPATKYTMYRIQGDHRPMRVYNERVWATGDRTHTACILFIEVYQSPSDPPNRKYGIWPFKHPFDIHVCVCDIIVSLSPLIHVGPVGWEVTPQAVLLRKKKDHHSNSISLRPLARP